MDEKERLNALEVALNNEMKEREFYLKHAGQTKNPLGKAMFKQIADEELEHYERLKELHKKWKKKDKWPETIPLTVKNTNIKEILVNTFKNIDKTAKADAGDLEAVKIAVDFEEKGTQFYAKLRDASTNPREKEFFELLAMIENEHYLSLRDAEEYFTDPTSWFIKAEHHTMDGG
ncbi:MAG: ferritin family protein [Proteobacteria bacterium]|nr:ferritin family protein [Pseudomonadota bacterium]